VSVRERPARVRRRPTREELAAAASTRLADLLAPGLRVVFVGINPSLYSAAVGCHFARPGNRFWPALHLAGFTPRLLSPYEQRELLGLGLGITNIAPRPTARADELTDDELRAGYRSLVAKVRRLRPATVAFLGVSAYRVATGARTATVGPQPGPLAGAGVWVLPNPSGLNAHYQLPDLARVYGELRAAADAG
jgi:TDG/mug DNA glycosylase family protein